MIFSPRALLWIRHHLIGGYLYWAQIDLVLLPLFCRVLPTWVCNTHTHTHIHTLIVELLNDRLIWHFDSDTLNVCAFQCAVLILHGSLIYCNYLKLFNCTYCDCYFGAIIPVVSVVVVVLVVIFIFSWMVVVFPQVLVVVVGIKGAANDKSQPVLAFLLFSLLKKWRLG